MNSESTTARNCRFMPPVGPRPSSPPVMTAVPVIIDHVFSQIELPSADGDWRTELRRRGTFCGGTAGRSA
ncbi:hypothetical protein [Kribbella speibonae]|uniref:hypothetical protein n=1 Tax=Kribbella speibonae TaxID=1572660 RepID=UPI001EDE1FBC|nr:hypothetical protein [Kribbella speibonae]